MKKSVAFSLPSPCTTSRIQACPRMAGGVFPGVGCDGTGPFPVLTTKVPGPSTIGAPPGLQMPAPLVWAGPALQLAVICAVVVETPNIQPCQGGASQTPAKPAYTTPSIRRIPGRCTWYLGSKVSPAWLSALPWICTGNPGRSSSVATSTACAQKAAGPEMPETYVLAKK